jgi:ferredoxin
MSDQRPPFVIDHELCVGHGRCYTLAPESFYPDDMGRGQVRDRLDGQPARDPDAIVNACPEGAIGLIAAGKGANS